MFYLSPSIVRCPWESFDDKSKILNALDLCVLHIDISYRPCENWLIYYEDFSCKHRELLKWKADFHLFHFEIGGVELVRKHLFAIARKEDSVILHIQKKSEKTVISAYLQELRSQGLQTWLAIDIEVEWANWLDCFQYVDKLIIMGIPLWTYKQSLNDIAQARRMEMMLVLEKCDHKIKIWLDWWVTVNNISSLMKDYDFLVIGSALFEGEDILCRWRDLQKEIRQKEILSI